MMRRKQKILSKLLLVVVLTVLLFIVLYLTSFHFLSLEIQKKNS